jgi:hypothetical protein
LQHADGTSIASKEVTDNLFIALSDLISNATKLHEQLQVSTGSTKSNGVTIENEAGNTDLTYSNQLSKKVSDYESASKDKM